ncbi:YfhO family protein, partial [Vibrio sp. FNV 38]|nr:YfhO family protein [Vibrio sp. FNV 38]
NVGHYSFDALHVYAVPMDLYEQSAKKLVKNKLDIDSFDNDQITGTVNAKTDSMVYMSILGTPGWNVSLDGKQVKKLDNVNISFIGFPVSAGTHKLEMHYTSPGLEKGILVSLIGLAIFLCLAAGHLIRSLLRKRKGRGEPSEEA